MTILQDFKKFILRGNMVELAIAVVVGTAFTATVNALVANIITPLIAAIGGQPDFSDLKFTINSSEFTYGLFLNALISLVIIAAVVFFLVIQPLNKLKAVSTKSKKTDDPTTKKCPECISEIPIKATRCAFCTAKLAPASRK